MKDKDGTQERDHRRPATTASVVERHLRTTNKAPRTIETYREAVTQFIAYEESGGPSTWAAVERKHVEMFIEHWLARWSPSTDSTLTAYLLPRRAMLVSHDRRAIPKTECNISARAPGRAFPRPGSCIDRCRTARASRGIRIPRRDRSVRRPWPTLSSPHSCSSLHCSGCGHRVHIRRVHIRRARVRHARAVRARRRRAPETGRA